MTSIAKTGKAQHHQELILNQKTGNKSEDSKISSDEEKTCRSNEESETIQHIRNLKYRDIVPGKVKEMLSPRKNTMPLQRHNELSLKSNELPEDYKDPRSKKNNRVSEG